MPSRQWTRGIYWKEGGGRGALQPPYPSPSAFRPPWILSHCLLLGAEALPQLLEPLEALHLVLPGHGLRHPHPALLPQLLPKQLESLYQRQLLHLGPLRRVLCGLLERCGSCRLILRLLNSRIRRRIFLLLGNGCRLGLCRLLLGLCRLACLCGSSRHLRGGRHESLRSSALDVHFHIAEGRQAVCSIVLDLRVLLPLLWHLERLLAAIWNARAGCKPHFHHLQDLRLRSCPHIVSHLFPAPCCALWELCEGLLQHAHLVLRPLAHRLCILLSLEAQLLLLCGREGSLLGPLLGGSDLVEVLVLLADDGGALLPAVHRLQAGVERLQVSDAHGAAQLLYMVAVDVLESTGQRPELLPLLLQGLSVLLLLLFRLLPGSSGLRSLLLAALLLLGLAALLLLHLLPGSVRLFLLLPLPLCFLLLLVLRDSRVHLVGVLHKLFQPFRLLLLPLLPQLGIVSLNPSLVLAALRLLHVLLVRVGELPPRLEPEPVLVEIVHLLPGSLHVAKGRHGLLLSPPALPHERWAKHLEEVRGSAL
mmetsp:Transcript_36400/g.102820  ORF Transcript_36400/g.102820 Transcript_36400/m.102820 type:complete len:534 (+) Transcript_36400:107-1708(+)